ncbi:ATP-binding cassette domain-containing protein [bacterium]|nr:ATP-binding cassette domain-containing protein [bacterium]
MNVAVDGISFDVQKGEILGFLGPNGAGKTTTMRILTCYIPPSSGTAKIEGYDTFEESIEVRKRVGYLPESAPLYHDMGVIDYLKFIATIRNIPGGKIKTRIKEMIQICGLQGEAHKAIGQLSKGYRQRVGLAQTLIHDPEILILDEPTSGLDPIQIIEIRDLIKKIGKEKTVILSSHILPEVQATCGRIIIINKGKLVESGTPQELSDRAKGQETVHMSVRGPLVDIRQKIEQMEHVINVHLPEGETEDVSEDGIHKLVISVEKGKDIKEDLFNCVVENKWSLTELRSEGVTLENVFKQLTTQEDIL